MYQKLVAFILIFLSYHVVNAQVIQDIPDKQNTKHYHLNGAVQQVTEQTYRVAISGDIESDADTFSPADTTHMIAAEMTLGFNNNKRLTLKQTSDYNIKRSKIDNTYTSSYNYDSDDKLISITRTENGKVIDSTAIDYNNNGRLEEMVVYDKKDRIIERRQFSYKNGKAFNIRIKDENNAIKNFVRLEYNKAGQVKERQFRGNSLQVLAIQLYKRKKTKDGTQLNIYDYVEGNRFRRLYSSLYDKKGNELQRTVTDSNKRVVEYRTLTYNKQNELIKNVAFINEKKESLSYQYKYDSNGNWIEQQVSRNGLPYEVRRRTITYYATTDIK